MSITPLIPGLWSVAGEAGTIAALGTIRESSDGTYAFFAQPAGSGAQRELDAARTTVASRSGFASVEAAGRYAIEAARATRSA